MKNNNPSNHVTPFNISLRGLRYLFRTARLSLLKLNKNIITAITTHGRKITTRERGMWNNEYRNICRETIPIPTEYIRNIINGHPKLERYVVGLSLFKKKSTQPPEMKKRLTAIRSKITSIINKAFHHPVNSGISCKGNRFHRRNIAKFPVNIFFHCFGSKIKHKKTARG